MADIMISQKCNPDSTAYLLSLSHVSQNLQNKIQTPLKMLHTSALAHSFCLLSCHSLMGALHSSLIKLWHLLFLEQLCLPCCSLLGGYPTSSFPLGNHFVQKASPDFSRQLGISSSVSTAPCSYHDSTLIIR